MSATRNTDVLEILQTIPTLGVEVIADNSGRWCGNGLVFSTVYDAENYARDLYCRWTLVREWRVVELRRPITDPSRLFPILEEPTHNVLCGCGWGQLNMRESQIPPACPLCGHVWQAGRTTDYA